MESKELIIAVVTILGSGAAFKFYESFIKTRRESARELRKEQREDNPETMFREDLLKRVNEMSAALDSAQSKILSLTQRWRNWKRKTNTCNGKSISSSANKRLAVYIM